MKKEWGHKPWHTANYAGGKLKGVAVMLREKRHIYDVFIQSIAAHKLAHKLIYQQLKPELKLDIIVRAKKLLLNKKLNTEQRALLERIRNSISVCKSKKLIRFHFQLTALEQQFPA